MSVFVNKKFNLDIIYNPDAEKDWKQEEERTTEDGTVGWHHQLNEHEFEQAQEDGEGQGSLACCNPRGHKELDTPEKLNNMHAMLGTHFNMK